MMKSSALKVDPQIHHRLKIQAAREGVTLRRLVNKLLSSALDLLEAGKIRGTGLRTHDDEPTKSPVSSGNTDFSENSNPNPPHDL